MNLVPSLLQAIVKVDGEAMVMHAGDKPYVVSPTGQIELASRGLTLEAVNGIVGQLLPTEIQNALDEFGAIQYELPAIGEFPGEHFTVVAARGGDDVWVEIRRRRVNDDDRVPDEFFAAPPQAAPGPIVEHVPPPPPTPRQSPMPEPFAAAPAAAVPSFPASMPPAEIAADFGDAIDAIDEPLIEALPVSTAQEVAQEVEISLEDDLVMPEATHLWPGRPPQIEVSESPSGDDSSYSIDVTGDDAIDIEIEIDEPMQPAATIWQQPAPELAAPVEPPIVNLAPPPRVAPPVVAARPVVTAPFLETAPPPMTAPPLVAAAAVVSAPPPAVMTPLAAAAAALVGKMAVADAPPVVASSHLATVHEPELQAVAPPAPEPRVVEPPARPPEPRVIEAPTPAPPAPLVADPPAPVWEEPLVAEAPAPVWEEPLVAEAPAPAWEEPLVGEPAAPAPPEPRIMEPPAPPKPHVDERPAALPHVSRVFETPDRRAVPPPATTEPPQPAVVLTISRSPIRAEAPLPHVSDPTLSGLERLLRVSSARGASTLYLSSESRPSVRVDGELQMLDGEPIHTSRDVESLLLTLMPERSHEALRTGALTEWICDIDGVGRVRCMSFRDQRGPGGVFRLMPTRPVSVEQLGLSRHVQSLAIEPEGLILVAGPRSSGKRTLMAAFVDLMNRTRRDHIITIEREINIIHERGNCFVSQREVRGNDDELLASARGALREDPDVLLIEELRTRGLMNVALEAAASGHLVVGGFPAHTATGAIDRIIDLYAPEHRRQVQFALADSLRGVIVQVLLRKVGGGRLAAREVLLNTPAVSSLIAEGKTSQLPMAIEGGRRYGMMPMNDTLVGLVQSGAVEARDAYRRSTDRVGFLAALNRQGIDTSFIERLA